MVPTVLLAAVCATQVAYTSLHTWTVHTQRECPLSVGSVSTFSTLYMISVLVFLTLFFNLTLLCIQVVTSTWLSNILFGTGTM